MTSQNDRIRILFVDQITLSSLLKVWSFGRSAETIWHFDPITKSVQRWIQVFRHFGIINTQVRQVEHNLGQVRNEAGEMELARLLSYTRNICSQIRREQLEPSALFEAMESIWERKKILLYFEKLSEHEVRMECLRIGLVEWILRTQYPSIPIQCVLLIENKHWLHYIEAHARSLGIKLASYGHRNFVTQLIRTCVRILEFSIIALSHVLKVLKHRTSIHVDSIDQHESPVEPNTKKEPTTRLAMHYWQRKLSFDTSERSEFFWLNGSDIPYSEVLLYDYVTDRPLDDDAEATIDSLGIKLLGKGPGIPAWRPTNNLFKITLHVHLNLIISTIKCLARGKKTSLYYLRKLSGLAKDYAFWYDFFSANRVRVNVATLNTTTGQVLAMDALNGVSASYQISVSNLIYPFHVSAGENVQFVFSPLFEQLWNNFETATDNFVQTGAIYDTGISNMNNAGRIDEIKKRLEFHGANFLICFFDENSHNRWYTTSSDKDATDDYEVLLKWLLEDPTLGIIFKPKHSPTLYQRIDRVKNLVDLAMATRRCEFLTSEHIVGSIYPAEAALMANICIGKLEGASAALEARLANVPTVMIDTNGFSTHPFYAWGRGRIIFDSWESLITTIKQYRHAPESYPDFGDWSPGLQSIDPFQDGQASLRMGRFLETVYEALKTGSSKEDALTIAANRHDREWGNAVNKPLDPIHSTPKIAIRNR